MENPQLGEYARMIKAVNDRFRSKRDLHLYLSSYKVRARPFVLTIPPSLSISTCRALTIVPCAFSSRFSAARNESCTKTRWHRR